MKATNILAALAVIFALPFIQMYGGGLGPVPVGTDPTFNSVTTGMISHTGQVNINSVNITDYGSVNGQYGVFTGYLQASNTIGLSYSYMHGISFWPTASDGGFYVTNQNNGTLASAQLGSVTAAAGGNVLHMLSSKPTVNGAGSPNDAYLDTTNSKLVLFTGAATAAEGAGTWKQVSLTTYTP